MTPALIPPAPLEATHDFSRFDCGKPALNDWLRHRALESEGRTARTYVVCEDRIVAGYYCVSAGSIERRSMPSTLRRAQGLPNFIPVTILGRLARDLRYRGTGLGSDLLKDALLRILEASRIVGSRAVLVHALDDDSARFWQGNEFLACDVGTRTFVLPIETIAAAL